MDMFAWQRLNYDFHAAITEEQRQSGAVEYNSRTTDWRPDPNADDGPDASPVGTELALTPTRCRA